MVKATTIMKACNWRLPYSFRRLVHHHGREHNTGAIESYCSVRRERERQRERETERQRDRERETERETETETETQRETERETERERVKERLWESLGLLKTQTPPLSTHPLPPMRPHLLILLILENTVTPC